MYAVVDNQICGEPKFNGLGTEDQREEQLGREETGIAIKSHSKVLGFRLIPVFFT